MMISISVNSDSLELRLTTLLRIDLATYEDSLTCHKAIRTKDLLSPIQLFRAAAQPMDLLIDKTVKISFKNKKGTSELSPFFYQVSDRFRGGCEHTNML